MKATRLKFYITSFALMFIMGMVLTPMIANAQDGDKDVKDNSSSFNDSVQFDDMEPLFYDATEDAKKDIEEVKTETGSGMMLYVGIAIVLIVVLVVLKKVGKKKA